MNIQYQAIETNFSQLMMDLEQCFSPSEIYEVVDFIENNEFGLALNTVIDIIVEENKFINNDVLKLITGLSDAMELDSEIIISKLSVHIR